MFLTPGRALLLLVAGGAVGLAAVRMRHRHADDAWGSPISRSQQGEAAAAGVVSRPALAKGDISIQNSDSSIELAIVGPNVVAGLSPKSLDKVRRETDTNSIKSTGFGASIERMVKKGVQTALSKQIEYPVRDIDDVRYEDGKLVFYWKNGKKGRLLEHSEVDDKPVLESFPRADAERFVAVFHERKNRGQ